MEWVGIAVSGLIGIWGVVWARKAYRLAQEQDDRARSNWVFRAFPTGPTATEAIGLQFTNEGAATVWAPEVDTMALEGFAVLSRQVVPRLEPGENMAITVRHDPRSWPYPTRLQLRWRTSPHRGRSLESWVDVSQWREVAATIGQRGAPDGS